MKVDEKIVKRFEELIQKFEIISSNKLEVERESVSFAVYHEEQPPQFYKTKVFNLSEAIQLGISCLNFLDKLFGKDNIHYISFEEFYKKFSNDDTNFRDLKFALTVIKSAKDDYENGYLFNTRTLIEAEIFDDLLEQAEELYKKGYYQASAIIAGCVLEDALRKLCDKNSITLQPKATIEPMNVELAKAGIYNKLWQKKITALADLRNKAAHNLGGFKDTDVEDMLRDIRRFMGDYFS